MFICSWSCIREYDRKEAEKMAYSKIKKDGTPAKPTGKKKPAEMPKVELVYDPEIAEEYRREQEQKKANEQARAEAIKEKPIKILGQDPLDCAALFSRVVKYGRYGRIKDPMLDENQYMTLTANNVDITLKADEWIRLSAEILLAMEQLGIKEV